MPSDIQERMWRPSGVVKKVRGRPLVLRMQFLVPAQLEVFYEWFADLSNYPKIFDHVISITPINPEQPFEVGKGYVEQAYNFEGIEEEFPLNVESIKPYRSIFIKAMNRKVASYFKFYFVGFKNGKTMFTVCQYCENIGWLKVKKLQFQLAMFYFFRKGKAAKKLRAIFRK